MRKKQSRIPLIARCVIALTSSYLSTAATAATHQYEHEDISIPAAASNESKRETFSFEAALDYLDKGALAWSRERQCVSCHTNGSYLLTRPSLTELAGPPSKEVRTFFESQLAEFQNQSPDSLKKGIVPTQLAYLAAGLANWDRHVAKRLSAQTTQALELMLSSQAENGSFSNDDCWPPLESSEYHGATVAALAILAAPNWEDSASFRCHEPQVKQLWHYLQTTAPPHDYAQLLLLWVAAEKPDLLDQVQKESLINRMLQLQRPDGGWSLRSFAGAQQWGGGNREEKLIAEGSYNNPESDGHQTGLVTYVLQKAGLTKEHPAVGQGLDWLRTNQRESGRWWTRSLNTDKFHFITYSGTCYPLLALAEAGEIRAQK
jgi:squalene-hopene/tetraprenyl-beta-curcumene cyclase